MDIKDIQEIRRKARSRAGDALIRAATAIVKGKVEPDGAEIFLKRHHEDEVSPLIYRAAVEGGALGSSGWGAELATQAVRLFLLGLAPMSAASKLFALAYDAPLPEGRATVSVPGVIPDQTGGFVGESDPIPVTSWQFGAATIGRKKLAIMTVITRELARGSHVEAEIRKLLQASAALTLDAALFSDSAATDEAPAGLFHGVTATLTPGFDSDPMINDLTSLASAVQAVSSDRLAYIASPARAAQISMRAPNLRYPVLATSAVPDDRVAAVALDGFAVSVDPLPDIVVSQEAILHMSDDPGEIVTGAGAVADPVRSLFQTASLSIRLLIDMDWTPRDERAVALVDGIAW